MIRRTTGLVSSNKKSPQRLIWVETSYTSSARMTEEDMLPCHRHGVCHPSSNHSSIVNVGYPAESALQRLWHVLRRPAHALECRIWPWRRPGPGIDAGAELVLKVWRAPRRSGVHENLLLKEWTFREETGRRGGKEERMLRQAAAAVRRQRQPNSTGASASNQDALASQFSRRVRQVISIPRFGALSLLH